MSPDPTAGYAAIVGSPIACLILLVFAVVYFVRRDSKRDEECAAERKMEAARLAEANAKHAAYLEMKGQEMAKALADNTNSNNNLAAVIERHITTIVRSTASHL